MSQTEEDERHPNAPKDTKVDFPITPPSTADSRSISPRRSSISHTISTMDASLWSLLLQPLPLPRSRRLYKVLYICDSLYGMCWKLSQFRKSIHRVVRSIPATGYLGSLMHYGRRCEYQLGQLIGDARLALCSAMEVANQANQANLFMSHALVKAEKPAAKEGLRYAAWIDQQRQQRPLLMRSIGKAHRGRIRRHWRVRLRQQAARAKKMRQVRRQERLLSAKAGGGAGRATSFPQFSRLPIHLQQSIWEAAAQPPMCAHVFDYMTWCVLLRHGHSHDHTCMDPMVLGQAVDLMDDRGLWSACRLSRAIVQRVYQKAAARCRNNDCLPSHGEICDVFYNVTRAAGATSVCKFLNPRLTQPTCRDSRRNFCGAYTVSPHVCRRHGLRGGRLCHFEVSCIGLMRNLQRLCGRAAETRYALSQLGLGIGMAQLERVTLHEEAQRLQRLFPVGLDGCANSDIVPVAELNRLYADLESGILSKL